MAQPTELYRREWTTDKGREIAVVSAGFNDDGSLRINGWDMGSTVEEIWGDDDYEYWIVIPPGEIPKLSIELLRHAFNAEAPLRFSDLRKLCEEAGIEVEFGNWI